MLGRLTFGVGVGVGYVLGARAGRERYEAIMQQVRGVRQRPEVQDAVANVKHQASDAASTAAETAKEKAAAAAAAAKSKVGHGSSDAAGTGSVAADTALAGVPAGTDLAVDEPYVDPLPGSTGLGTGSAPAPVVPTSGTANI